MKHHLTLPEQQRGSTAAFSSALLFPEVLTLPKFLNSLLFLLSSLLYLIVSVFLSVSVSVRGRSCGPRAWTRQRCAFGTSRTPANRFTAWFYRTAPPATA